MNNSHNDKRILSFQKQSRSKSVTARVKPQKKVVSTKLNVSEKIFNKNEYYHNEFSQSTENNHRTVVNPRSTSNHLHFTDSSSEDTNNESSRLSSADDDDDDLLYENGTLVTCRNLSDSFYLCQVLQNVYTSTKSIRIRWCSVIGEKGDDTNISINTKFKLDYTDKLDPDTILMDIPDPIEYPDDTISLKKQHIIDTKRLLEKSIRGGSLSSDDMMDLSTEHQRSSPTKKSSTPFHIHFESNDESDTSASSQSTIPVSLKNNKRKKTVRQKNARKQPVKRQRQAKASPEVSDEETKSVKPKKKRMDKYDLPIND
jgi:hypothetical protein